MVSLFNTGYKTKPSCTGSFGYGYSHQLYGLNEKTTHERVQDSIFFRLPGLDVSYTLSMRFSIKAETYLSISLEMELTTAFSPAT